MVLNQHNQRIDTLELKALIIRKIGHPRAGKYFDQLKSLFCLKLNKREFDRSCVRIIGRENISLHNQIIGSIIKNACLAKAPASKVDNKLGTDVNISNGYQRNCLQSRYGNAFPSSPRNSRTTVNLGNKFRDRPSPLGPLGKLPHVVSENLVSKVQEQQSPTELLSLDGRPPVEVASVEDGEEVEQVAGSPGVQSRSSVRAPLGVSVNMGASRKVLSTGSLYNNDNKTCQNSDELPDTRSLKCCLERKLAKEGLNVSLDCVNLLNNGLDTYLKRLIEPCLDLAGSRHEYEHLNPLKGHYFPTLNGNLPGRHVQRSTKFVCGSLSDFCVSMELNPKVLGEDWPMQLEKICLRESDN